MCLSHYGMHPDKFTLKIHFTFRANPDISSITIAHVLGFGEKTQNVLKYFTFQFHKNAKYCSKGNGCKQYS